MPNIMQFLPELEGEEMTCVQGLIKDLDDSQAQIYASAYRARRKDPQLILLTTLLGFIGLAGVQRFILGQIGMGLLYLFTAGFCLIGTIIDLVNARKLAFGYNVTVAQQLALTVKGST
jgi:TM2 domain-containing membrane protein YozV